MLYNFFKKLLHIIIYSSSLTYGYSSTQNTQHYTFTYMIIHPSLGPIANNYTLESQKLRIAYFQQNYQKWLALKKNTYSIAYQDKAFEDIYIDGLKVGVKNNKISTLEDIFSIKQVNLSEKEKVKTINQLFKFIKRRINKKNKLTLLYDIQYGYPYYIKNKADKIEIFLHNLN